MNNQVPDFSGPINGAWTMFLGIIGQFWPFITGIIGVVAAVMLVRTIMNKVTS